MKIELITYLSQQGIDKISESYKAIYMGSWAKKIANNTMWSEFAIPVFYQPNPDFEKGHTHYFGIYVGMYDNQVYITDASSCFLEPFAGVIHEDTVLVSKYRHDYIARGNVVIDGGRDYTRTNGCDVYEVTVEGPDFFLHKNDETIKLEKVIVRE